MWWDDFFARVYSDHDSFSHHSSFVVASTSSVVRRRVSGNERCTGEMSQLVPELSALTVHYHMQMLNKMPLILPLWNSRTYELYFCFCLFFRCLNVLQSLNRFLGTGCRELYNVKCVFDGQLCRHQHTVGVWWHWLFLSSIYRKYNNFFILSLNIVVWISF